MLDALRQPSIFFFYFKISITKQNKRGSKWGTDLATIMNHHSVAGIKNMSGKPQPSSQNNTGFVIFTNQYIKLKKEGEYFKRLSSYILLPNIWDSYQMALNQYITSREMTEAISESLCITVLSGQPSSSVRFIMEISKKLRIV